MNWKDKKNAHLVPGRAWDSTLSSSLPTPWYYPFAKTKGQKLREVKPLAQSHKADPWKGQDARPGGQCPKSLSSCGPHPVPGLQESLPELTSGAVPNCAWGRASRRRTWQKCPSSKRIPDSVPSAAECRVHFLLVAITASPSQPWTRSKSCGVTWLSAPNSHLCRKPEVR